jgi:hypothetical protein
MNHGKHLSGAAMVKKIAVDEGITFSLEPFDLGGWYR